MAWHVWENYQNAGGGWQIIKRNAGGECVKVLKCFKFTLINFKAIVSLGAYSTVLILFVQVAKSLKFDCVDVLSSDSVANCSPAHKEHMNLVLYSQLNANASQMLLYCEVSYPLSSHPLSCFLIRKSLYGSDWHTTSKLPCSTQNNLPSSSSSCLFSIAASHSHPDTYIILLFSWIRSSVIPFSLLVDSCGKCNLSWMRYISVVWHFGCFVACGLTRFHTLFLAYAIFSMHYCTNLIYLISVLYKMPVVCVLYIFGLFL